MSLTIHPTLSASFAPEPRGRDLTMEAYVDRLLQVEQQAEDELAALALEGLDSGEPTEAGPDYWERKHRQVEERLRAGAR